MSSVLEGLERQTLASLERLNVEQYHAMIQAGILREGAPIELIDGLLFRKDRRDGSGNIMTVGPQHAQTVRRLIRVFTALCADLNGFVQSQQPVTLSESDEPEPDVSVIRGPDDDFADRHPGTDDIAICCEVSDSSLSFDRGKKLATYALAGVPEYWIIDLRHRTVETFSVPQPIEENYSQHRIYREEDAIEFRLLGKTHTIAVKDILTVKKPSN